VIRCSAAGFARATVVLLAATVVAAAAQAEERNPLEMAVKAAFLDKFQFYVAWPERAYASATSPFTLCVVGDEPFAALVERAASGQSVAAHPVVALFLRTAAAADHCQILFIAAGDAPAARQQLAAVAGQPVLTVTDGSRDAAATGMINFVIASNRVRFEIDAALAARCGLAISSKLLSLALSARPAP